MVNDDADSRLTAADAALILLLLSLTCVALAPTLMPDSYSLITHSVSESAAQRVEGAWLARAGFLLLGFAVLLIASRAQGWGRWGRMAHRVYGAGLLASAAFSHRSWEPIPFDAFEDTLHSAAATLVGLAFVGGVTIVAFRRPAAQTGFRAFDVIAVVVAMIVSALVGLELTNSGGMLQRLMFLVGYLWYGVEAARLAGASRRRPALQTQRPNTENTTPRPTASPHDARSTTRKVTGSG